MIVTDLEAAVLRENAMRIAREHRARCSDEACDVSLHLLGKLLVEAGVDLTNDEWLEFL